ncbi:MAG: helix-turn-helix transcriptional regulator [Armatimonadetes bacterium]|nr:helix-turn-helix transcriptional regulator [Armatimonadota bacterium]
METKDAAAMFKALGDPTRLSIFQFVRGCCCEVAVGEQGEVRPVAGPTVGEVCCHVHGPDKPLSSVSFHLKELRTAGLIHMDKRGKNMVCSTDRASLRRLAEFLTEPSLEGDCCTGVSK